MDKKRQTTKSGGSTTEQYCERVYLFGFMPLPEANGVLFGDIGAKLDQTELRERWLKKTLNVAKLAQTDPYVIDDSNVSSVAKDFDESLKGKLDATESKLLSYPFWKATPHRFKLVEIDKLIALQNNINLNRVRRIQARISKDAALDDLIDFCFDFGRPPSEIAYNMVAQNAYLFSSEDEDVRVAQPHVRILPRYEDNGQPLTPERVPSLVIQVTAGEPFIYAIRTFSIQPTSPNTVVKRYQITLQNGFHRAYALKSLGFTHMPCILVDPVSSSETSMLQGNWSPERIQQTTQPRPPLMKDFFNPALIERVKVRKRRISLKVSWGTEKYAV